MPAIEDISIEPIEGSKSLFHGYLGVTPVATVSGNLKFLATKSISIASVKISLFGELSASISGIGEWRPDSTPSPASPFIHPKVSRMIFLEQSKILLAPASADAKKKSERSISLKAGTHSFPFEFTLLEKVTSTLPPSVATQWSDSAADNVNISYKLEAEVGLAPGLFGSTIKIEKRQRALIFPRIDVPTVLRREGADTSVVIAGVNEQLEWRVSVDKSIFGIKDPVKFYCNIQSVSVAIRQDTVISIGEGLTRVIRELISVPEVAGRIINTSGKSGTPIWAGEVYAAIDSTHWRSRKDHRSVDALQDITCELFAVRHAFEITIKMKGEPEFKVEAPCIFIEADGETRAWVLRNAAAIQEENEE
ncbi:hypothetical protein BC829DRAFT_398912 [Chytridium lagenaria]|nr:hypothetical protein BC829DRAFT_398912 [Chytridium lagenaria]